MFLYVVRKYLQGFLVMVIQFIIPLSKKENICEILSPIFLVQYDESNIFSDCWTATPVWGKS